MCDDLFSSDLVFIHAHPKTESIPSYIYTKFAHTFVYSLPLPLSLPLSPSLSLLPADPPEGNSLPTAGSTATPTTSTTSPATTSSATSGGGVATSAAAGATGGATALFPCLVYYPGSQNYSLIWVPMDGSNPIVSGANILGGSGAITIPTQVRRVVTDYCNNN